MLHDSVEQERRGKEPLGVLDAAKPKARAEKTRLVMENSTQNGNVRKPVSEEELLACIQEAAGGIAALEARMPLSFQLNELWAKLEPCLPPSTQPLEGLCVVYGAPIFLNSMPILVSLIRMGAKLFITDCLVGADDFKEMLRGHTHLYRLPDDQNDLAASIAALGGEGPVVCLDNGALLRKFLSGQPGVLHRARFVELTAKGDAEFWTHEGRTAGFCSVNSIPVKLLESAMGTADSFMRHLSSAAVREQLRRAEFDPDFSLVGRHLVVIGAGRVGLGIARFACKRWVAKYDMKLTVMEKNPLMLTRVRDALDCICRQNEFGRDLEAKVRVVDTCDSATLVAILSGEGPQQCIICTATGVQGLLSQHFPGVVDAVRNPLPTHINSLTRSPK